MNASSLAVSTPRIGITPEGLTDDGQLLLPLEYLNAIQRAGGVPLVLSPWHADACVLLDAVSGLLLAGGGDVSPRRYGSNGHACIYGVDEVRDEGELALFFGARRRSMPILGICRGAQLTNVALGGTLITHLPERTTLLHRAEPKGGVLHQVNIASGSRLHAALAEGGTAASPIQAEVMSWHHQAIDRVATGLTVTAQADDGTIEAVETGEGPWLVAVQWHPELTAAVAPMQQRLFNAFVAACRQDSAQPAGDLVS